MDSARCLVRATAVAAVIAALGACKKSEPPKPDPAAAGSAKPHAVAPRNAPPRPDPQTMKLYRLDVCYYGTLNLRAARDAYLGSLGKDEPSEKKLPNFGVSAPATTPPALPAPLASAAPSAVASAKPAPKPSAAPSPSAAGSANAAVAKLADAGAALPPPAAPMPPVRLPYERSTRACLATMNLKDPAMPEVDAAIAAYANFATELANNLTKAAGYYWRDEYKKDGLAQGKELDKKLREAFAKLDELQAAVGNAIAGWQKAHPADESKAEEGEKLFGAVLESSRDAVLLVVMKKAEPEAFDAATKKVEATAAALKTFGTDHASDAWARQSGGIVDGLLKTLKETKVTPAKTFDPESLIGLINQFTSLLEARHRAQMATLRAKAHSATPAIPPGSPSAEQEAPR